MAIHVDVKELLEAGAHFGHKTSHWNPKMRPYIHSQRGHIYIIDLVKTAAAIEQAAEFVRDVAQAGKQVLFVGTKRHLRDAVRTAAEDARMPYVVNRWFGGTLTNFATIHKRVQYLKKLEEQLSSGELKDTYNKKEIADFQEEADKLNESFYGLKEMDRLPGALFVAGVHTDYIAVQEAHRLGIPVVGVVDTNANPELVDHVIPANDDARSTIQLVSQLIAQAAQEGASKAKTKAKTTTDAKAQPTSSTKA